ncbi:MULTISPECIES: BID domain-containing T4SS effector [unclassified Bartonella]|uniref:BID domain-containing T4SS effector n=1 Tax=unclassified Bartonella TaxID=2645622 RepID=UPI00099957F8|nr:MULTISPECIES: BID domain-containing T4SS effector [unclassified Bartonella]AQX22604.1 Bartonella effector protein Bep10 [Bartonella sp. 11B]AQX24113.1 Bartonella effector protein Bep10 [Bartonella sp. 114]AQX25053.1 Bartonella effector protein Bep10 [Bartonella sp. Coyote22sub2]
MSIKDSQTFKNAEKSLLKNSINYTYAESGDPYTLINKFGIQDHQKLKIKCAHQVTKELVNVHQEPIPQKVDQLYLKELHKRLFGNVFDWAGKTRDNPIKMSNGKIATMLVNDKNSPFASNEKLSKCLNELDAKLAQRAQRNEAGNTSQKKVSDKNEPLSEDIATIYALLGHARPFVEGNGIVQRLFVDKLSQAENQKLDFSVVTQKRMEDAIVSAANDNLQPMQHLFEDASNPENIKVLKTAINRMKPEEAQEIAREIITTPISGKTYTGVYESRQLDTVIIKTRDSLIVCNKCVIPREQFQKLKLGDKISFKALSKLSDVFIPGKELRDLTDFKIMEKTVCNSYVLHQRKEIERLAKVVFGNREKLTNRLERIHDNPNSAKMLSETILHNPKSIAKLAGFGRYGINSPKRNKAEKSLSALSEAILRYGSDLKTTKEEVLREHREEQYRIAKEVSLPGKEIQRYLGMSKEERESALKIEGNVAICKEISDFLKQVNSRLSASERKMVNSGSYQSLAESIGIPEDKAKQITDTIKQIKVVQKQAMLIREPRQQTIAIAS